MLRQPRTLPLLGTVALTAILALTGCSTGQVTQTSSQVSTVGGAAADVGLLSLRDIRILYPSSGSYSKGSTAKLVLLVTNESLDEDSLLDVTGDFFDSASVPSDEEDSEPRLDAPVPAQGVLQFGTREFPSIELTDLSEELSVAQVVTMTFVFENAGEVTVEVPVANPTREIDRGEGFDFNSEQG